jgi:hypothetical protein
MAGTTSRQYGQLDGWNVKLTTHSDLGQCIKMISYLSLYSTVFVSWW